MMNKEQRETMEILVEECDNFLGLVANLNTRLWPDATPLRKARDDARELLEQEEALEKRSN